MALSAVTISGASSGNLPLLSKRQAKLAAGSLAKHINKSTINSSIAPQSTSYGAASAVGGADTIFAGAPGLLISMGGVDTLGSARSVLQFQSSRFAGKAAQSIAAPGTPTIAAVVSFASAGNLTLGGAAMDTQAAQPGPADSVTAGANAIATVFGAAITGSVLAFDPGPAAANQPPNVAVSVTGAAPDLLLGWTFGTPGYTVNLGAGQGGWRGTQLNDSTNVRFSGLPTQGTIEIIFPK